MPVSKVQGWVGGEHGEAAITLWSTTKVEGLPVDEYVKSKSRILHKAEIDFYVKSISKFIIDNVGGTEYGPVAIPKAKTIFKNKITYASSAVECLKEADCCILLTEWEEFKKLKPENFTQNMKQPILIDGRRIYNQKEFSRKLKFTAIGLGEFV